MPSYRVLLERRFLFEITDVVDSQAAIVYADDVFRQIDDQMVRSRYPRTKVLSAKSSRKRVVPIEVVLDPDALRSRVAKIKGDFEATHESYEYDEAVRMLNAAVVKYLATGLCPDPGEIAAIAESVNFDLPENTDGA